MKMEMYRDLFIKEFMDYRPNNYTIGALHSMFDYFEGLEDDLGEEMTVNVIAICCDFSEYNDLKEFQIDYGTKYETIEDIRDETTVIEIPGTNRFIVESF